MFLLNKSTKKQERAVILLASLSDLKAADKSGRFEFNWELEKKKEVYKLQIEATGEVIGLMALEDIPREVRIDIHVLEASKENVGANKIYSGVAGCLIAFACRQAFLRGYSGFISLTPKDVLSQHYIDAYGFVGMGVKLCSFDENSESLIEKYLGG